MPVEDTASTGSVAGSEEHQLTIDEDRRSIASSTERKSNDQRQIRGDGTLLAQFCTIKPSDGEREH